MYVIQGHESRARLLICEIFFQRRVAFRLGRRERIIICVFSLDVLLSSFLDS